MSAGAKACALLLHRRMPLHLLKREAVWRDGWRTFEESAFLRKGVGRLSKLLIAYEGMFFVLAQGCVNIQDGATRRMTFAQSGQPSWTAAACMRYWRIVAVMTK